MANLSDMDILSVSNLSKKFGEFTAVNDISFELKEGEILGLLGPNGAGKTTTLQMLLGVLTPTSGKIKYFGKDLEKKREEILEKVNFSSTYTDLPWIFSVKENLTFISYLYDISDRKKRLTEIVEMFKLEDIFNKKMTALSAGQLTRVNLAKAFLNSPKILLLDEPTASLDPDIASYIRNLLLKERQKSNISIVITSHNMAEVEELCDRIIFINHGQIIANDTPLNLTRSVRVSHLELLLDKSNGEALKKYLVKNEFVFRRDKRHIVVDIDETKIGDFLIDISREKINYTEISIDKPSLEDYFLQMSRKEKLNESA